MCPSAHRHFFVAIVLAMLTSMVSAGDLVPSDPPASTTNLSEPRIPISSLPFSIDEPGSYYVTANLTGVSGQNGISIATDNVSIDLCGFALTGVPGAYSGIIVPALGGGFHYQNIAISNGIISDWPSSGIYSNGVNCRFERLTVAANSSTGIITSADCLILSCQSNSNTGDGILTGSRCQVIQCTATNNGDDGIVANAGSLVRNCTASENVGNGIWMFNAGLCLDNICERNGRTNNKAGIALAGSGHRIEGNLLLSNGVGITTAGGSASLIVGNAVCNTLGDDFDVTTGNFLGTVVTTSGGVATSNAWANFAY